MKRYEAETLYTTYRYQNLQNSLETFYTCLFDRVTALNEVNADILTLYVPGCFVHLLLILYQMECYEAVTYCQHSHTSIKNDH